DAFDVGLSAELSFRTDFLRDAGDFGSERTELVDHGVDRALELEDFAAGIDGDLLREVAHGDGGGDLGDVTNLVGEVRGEAVDVVGEVLPDARHALHVGLAAQASFGADFLGDAGDFRGERGELVHHD